MDRRGLLKHGAAFVLGSFAVPAGAMMPAATSGLGDDLAIIREALKLHPGLYRYNSPRRIEEHLARLSRLFVPASSIEQRYFALSRFLSAVRCGHSYANFYNQKKAVAAQLFDRRTRLPFEFIWSGDAMLVTRDPAGQLPPGTLVRAVDDRRVFEMRRALMPLVRADGGNDDKRRSLLEVQGLESIETFDVFQGLMFPPRTAGVFSVDARFPDGRDGRIDLPALGLADRKAMRRQIEPETNQPIWTWEQRADGIALLTMPDWSMYNSKWDWRAWLEERLDSLGGAKGLIVDLRRNEGGNDCGDPILARLIDRDFRPPRQQQRIRFQRTPVALDPYLDTWNDSFRTMGLGAKPLENGFFLRPGADEDSAIARSPKRIGVPVAVLIGPVNSSATFGFARNVRDSGAAKLYGQPTGGNLRGINGAAYFFVRLPESGLEFDLPLVGYFPLDPQPDAGVRPHVIVAPTPADIAQGRDPALDRAASDLLRS